MSCSECCPENKWDDTVDPFLRMEHVAFLPKLMRDEGRSITRYQRPCQQPIQRGRRMFERCISPNLAPAQEAEEATIASSVYAMKQARGKGCWSLKHNGWKVHMCKRIYSNQQVPCW